MTLVTASASASPSSRRPSAVAALALLAGGLLCSAPALPAQALGPSTRVEYDLSYTERIAGSNVVSIDTNLPAGVDGADLAQDVGGILGTYGSHTLDLEASVDALNGSTRLSARGEHHFSMTGINRTTDYWRLVTGTQTLQATHVDELTLTNVPDETLTVEMYWDVRGTDVVVIDLNPGDFIYQQLDTDVRLDASTVSPQSGGGSYVETVPWPLGYLNVDVARVKNLALEQYVVMTFTVDPSELLEVETTFEVVPYTSLNNAIEGFASSLFLAGEHSAFFDQSAELVGVVVRDALGEVIPDAVVDAASGYTYPVLEEPPTPPAPARVILSPVAIEDTDLGEVSPAQAPLENMINQSGLDKAFTSGVTSFDGYFDFNPAATAQVHYSGNWQSQADHTLPLTGYVDFDLGGTRWIDRLAIWNLSLENVRVQIADSAAGPWTELGAFTLPSHLSYFSTYPVDVLDLGGVHQADYLRIQVDSAYKDSSTDTFAYATVGEVAVGALPLPEPGSAWLLLAGVPTVALLRRRRAAERRLGAQT